MCAIAGILNLNKNPIDKRLLMKMVRSMSHRGPDDEGFYVSEYLGIGNRRLSIIDLSQAGHQPMANRNRTIWITYNGEIYNFREIKAELESIGYCFKSTSDTEVIIYAYEEWGEGCLNRLNGIFAFALWNEEEKKLLLARDHIGVKPLYYYLNDTVLLFASEIKSILQNPFVPRKIEAKGLFNFFTYGHSLGPDTIYQGIKKLLPGHYLMWQKGRIHIVRYWDIPLFHKKRDHGFLFYQEKLYSLLHEVIRDQLVADVPVGVFLSGGIDSSTIVAMACRSQSKVKTFSIGFDQPGAVYNELHDARLVANAFNTDHYEIMLKEKNLIEILQKLVYSYDEPYADSAAFPLYIMCTHARQYVKVCLSGDGGDELFAGYWRYVAEQFSPYYQFLPFFFREKIITSLVSKLPRFRRVKKIAYTMGIKDPITRYASWLMYFTDEMKECLFSEALLEKLETYDSFEVYKRYYPKNQALRLDKILYVDQKTWLVDDYLEKSDKAGMAHGLEIRVPLLDRRLVEFTATIPASYKIHWLKKKYILKEAVKYVLPKKILKKPKVGFATPIDPWFRNQLKDFLWEVLFDTKTRSRPYFNFSYIEELYKKHLAGKEVFDQQLWFLLIFELWHREFID